MSAVVVPYNALFIEISIILSSEAKKGVIGSEEGLGSEV